MAASAAETVAERSVDDVLVTARGAREEAAADGDGEWVVAYGGRDRPATASETILRFVTTERALHWAIAIPFLGCLGSAAVLVLFYNPVPLVVSVYNPDPTRAYRYVFASVHRACGAGLILCPSLVLLCGIRHLPILLRNVREAWGWRLDDIKWLALMGPATLFKRIVLPDQGKFNAAEKLNFMMVTVFSPLLAATGVLMWHPDLTHLDPLAPWVVHVSLAVLAAPLLAGHMFMATINPSTRVGLMGMISGYVSAEWAAHHYARWFREQYPELARERAAQHGGDAGAAAPAPAETECRLPVAAGEPAVCERIDQRDVNEEGAASFAGGEVDRPYDCASSGASG